MFHQCTDISEALAVRARLGSAVTPISGGTDLVVALNRSGASAEHYLDLSRVKEFDAVNRDANVWRLAGGANFTTIGRLPVRALAEAAMTIGGPAIRNRGTIGGNLGTASPAGDACVALMALDAEIELTHATRGSRIVPVADYFKGFRKTALQPDELITAVRVPADWNSVWYKIGKRGSINISLVCCAVGRSPKGDIRIAFGCVAPTVVRPRSAESIIMKDALTDAAIAAAADAAMKDVAPIDDHRCSAAYRRAMCGVLTRRLLGELRDELKSNGVAA